MKLLIVDDEYFVVQGVLDGVNWELLNFEDVLTAYSYAQAVEIMENGSVEIVLCDIEMPDESGLDLVAWVNKHHPNTECIILSCHDEFDFARQAVELKCMDYVLKPVRYEKLTDILHHAMEEVEEKKRQMLMKDYGQIYLDQMAKKKNKDYVDAAKTVADYIQLHLESDLSVRGLANMVYISPDHLTRTFKKKYGVTVSDYILEKRMELAGELLRREDLSITMVSDSVGYGNYSFFTEQFKKKYGVTPREYQKEHRNTGLK